LLDHNQFIQLARSRIH